MKEERMKYENLIAECKKRWGKLSAGEREGFDALIGTLVNDFILYWDTLKAIEKKFNIDVMSIAREERWKNSFEGGQRMAQKCKEHGVKDLYLAYNALFEGLVDAEWLECNDQVFHKWNHSCPCIPHFKKLGKTDEEIREMADLFCLADIGTMAGFNPKLEIFPQPRLLMRGDSHCSYRSEDHGGK